MKTLGYYNGTYDELDKMMVPMNDRACYFGDGVYDATYSHNYKIYCLDAHVDRFFNSAKLMEMELPWSKAEIKALLQDLVAKLDGGDQFVYWQVTRGTAARDHAYPGTPVNLWVRLHQASVADTYQATKVVLAEDTRFFHCNVKTLNLLPNVLASEKAKQAGCHEAIFHRGERVTECAHSNIHMLKNGVLHTHPADCHILPGIARANLIAACGAVGVPVVEEAFTVAEMMVADEVIISSSGTFCMPVSHVDETPVGGKGGDILKRLQDYLVADFQQATV